MSTAQQPAWKKNLDIVLKDLYLECEASYAENLDVNLQSFIEFQFTELFEHAESMKAEGKDAVESWQKSYDDGYNQAISDILALKSKYIGGSKD